MPIKPHKSSSYKPDQRFVKAPHVSANISMNASTSLQIAPMAPKCSPLDKLPFDSNLSRKPKSTTSKVVSFIETKKANMLEKNRVINENQGNIA